MGQITLLLQQINSMKKQKRKNYNRLKETEDTYQPNGTHRPCSAPDSVKLKMTEIILEM